MFSKNSQSISNFLSTYAAAVSLTVSQFTKNNKSEIYIQTQLKFFISIKKLPINVPNIRLCIHL